MITAIILVIILYAYWYFCRLSAFYEKEKLVDTTIAYLDDKNAPDTMKYMVYFSFIGSDRCWFFPLICLMFPFVFMFAIESKPAVSEEDTGQGTHVSFKRIMESIVLICIKRHPIISTFFALVSVLLVTITISLKIIFGNLKNIPNLSHSIILTANLINGLRAKIHA